MSFVRRKTLASLRSSVPVSDATSYTSGHSAISDGVVGEWRGVAGASAGTYVDNGGTVLVPSGSDGSAAWLRVYSGPLSVLMFGATGDGVTDDTAAIQATYDEAARLRDLGKSVTVIHPEAAGFVVSSVNLGHGISLIQHAPMLASQGTAPVLTVGETSEVNTGAKLTGLSVTIADPDDSWGNPGSIAIKLINCNACEIDLREVNGFEIGLQCMGDGQGWAYNEVRLRTVRECRVGVELTNANSGWCNENNFYGGRFTKNSGNRASTARDGVKITSSDGAYLNNNSNVFHKPSFELFEPTPLPSDYTTEVSTPVRIVHGVRNSFLRYRDEGNGNLFLRTENGSEDNFADAGYYPSGGIYDTSSAATNKIYGGRHDPLKGYVLAARFHLPSEYRQESTTSRGFERMSVLEHGDDNPKRRTSAYLKKYGDRYVKIGYQRAVGVELDTTDNKYFLLQRGIPDEGRGGRFVIRAWDAANNSVNDTDIFGDGFYSSDFFDGPNVSGSYGGSVDLNDGMHVRFSDNVVRAWVGVARNGLNDATVESFSIYTPNRDPVPNINSGDFQSQDVPGCIAIYDASQSVTLDASGLDVTEIADGAGEDNGVAASDGASEPGQVTGWRNQQDSIDIQTGEDMSLSAFVAGAMSQPYTIYAVAEMNTSGDYVYDGVTSRAALFRNGANMSAFAGSSITTSTQPGNGTPFLSRFVANGASSTLRIEPDGEPVITASGNAGSNDLDGVALGTRYDLTQPLLGDFAFYMVVQGDLPTDNAVLEERLMAHLSERFDIVHS